MAYLIFTNKTTLSIKTQLIFHDVFTVLFARPTASQLEGERLASRRYKAICITVSNMVMRSSGLMTRHVFCMQQQQVQLCTYQIMSLYKLVLVIFKDVTNRNGI